MRVLVAQFSIATPFVPLRRSMPLAATPRIGKRLVQQTRSVYKDMDIQDFDNAEQAVRGATQAERSIRDARDDDRADLVLAADVAGPPLGDLPRGAGWGGQHGSGAECHDRGAPSAGGARRLRMRYRYLRPIHEKRACQSAATCSTPRCRR